MHPFPVRQVILEFRPFFLITTRLFTRCQHTTPFGSPLAQSSGPCTFYRRKGLIFLNGEKLCDYSTKAKCSSSSLNTCLGDARLLCIDQTRFLYKGFNLLHFGSQASTPLIPEELDQNVYEDIADETLEALYTYFDEILESSPVINNGDVSFSKLVLHWDDNTTRQKQKSLREILCRSPWSSGVLTIKLGKHGTYVINKQTPNRQIWLSSPTSGPKRYDYINKTWIYRHDGVSLYKLLDAEIPKIVGLNSVDFTKYCNIQTK